jgi:NodT family efflux transporter outer membrane factor (OMF) lipoprotein
MSAMLRSPRVRRERRLPADPKAQALASARAECAPPRTRWPRAALAAAIAVAGCAGPPPYRPPSIEAPASFKEAPTAEATWFPAAPADALDRGPWWELFGDPALNALEVQVDVSNQNVAAAVANYAQAQALVRQAKAALLPSLTLAASATRSGGGAGPERPTIQQLGLEASWEPDVWGQLGDAAAGAEASLQRSAATLAAARLSAQAALATDYFALRESDHEIDLLRQAVAAYERALRITQNQYRARIVARTDVLQAQTQVESTRANVTAAIAQRAQLEHAIALLVGRPAAEFSIPVAEWEAYVPAVPLALPSELLQRRPDIAAAERAVAVANAQVGVARAAYFPSLALSASYGGAGASFASLLRASNTVWSLGVSAAQTLFDAGAKGAAVEAAQAARDAAVANYRQTVLVAFASVEDQLAVDRSLAEQDGQRRAASRDADLTERLTFNQYLQAQVSYTSVVTAQVTALAARQTLSQLMSSRQASAVALIQALGGGWHAPPSGGATSLR